MLSLGGSTVCVSGGAQKMDGCDDCAWQLNDNGTLNCPMLFVACKGWCPRGCLHVFVLLEELCKDEGDVECLEEV